MQLVAIVLTLLSCAGIIGIGVAYLWRPGAIAAGFGFGRQQPASPFHGVKGVRDVATGAAGLALLLLGQRVALGVVMLCFALVPLGDMVLVLVRRGDRAAALGVHGATAALVAGTGLVWLLVS